MQQLAAVGDRADCSCTRWLQIWITVEPGCSTAALVTAGNITRHDMGSGDWSSAAVFSTVGTQREGILGVLKYLQCVPKKL